MKGGGGGVLCTLFKPRWLKQGESQTFKAYEKKGDFPQMPLFKWPELYFGDDRCRWCFINKLTGKYFFFFYQLQCSKLLHWYQKNCKMSRPIYHSQCINNSKYSKGCHYCHTSARSKQMAFAESPMPFVHSLFIILSDNSECFFLSFSLCLKSHSPCICQILPSLINNLSDGWSTSGI